MDRKGFKGLPQYFFPALIGVGIIIAGCMVIPQWLDAYSILSKIFKSVWLLAIVTLGSLVAYFQYVRTIYQDNLNAADSVYYFGFSLTITTLALSSIVHFGAMTSEAGNTENLENLSLVFSQFGVGLMATCLGLILRLYLIAKADDNEEDDLDTIDEDRARQKMIADLTTFSNQLNEIHQVTFAKLQQQQQEFHQKAIQDFQRLSTAVLQDIRDKSVAVIENIHQQKMLLEQSQVHIIDDALNNFKTRIKTSGQELAEIHSEMSKLKFDNISQQINHSLSDLSLSLNNFSAVTSRNSENLNFSLEKLVHSTNNATSQMQGTVADLGEMTQGVVNYRQEIDVLVSSLGQTNHQWATQQQRLENHVQSLDEMLNNYHVTYQQYHESSVEAVKQSQDAVNQVAQALTQVAKIATKELKV